MAKSNNIFAVCHGQTFEALVKKLFRVLTVTHLQNTGLILVHAVGLHTPLECASSSRREEALTYSPPRAGVCSAWVALAPCCVPGVLGLAPSSASCRLWSCNAFRCSRCDLVTMAAFSGPRFAICSGDNAWEE